MRTTSNENQTDPQRAEGKVKHMPITPRRYTMRPYAVEAIQWTDDVDPEEIARWCGGKEGRDFRPYIKVPNVEEVFIARPTRWILRDRNGQFSVMEDEEFNDTYEINGGDT